MVRLNGPACLVWSRADFFGFSEDNISPRMEDMIRKHYTKLEFPMDIHILAQI